MEPESIEVERVQRFLGALRQRVQTAYLYGSQVRGTATEWSDIDIAVVSPDFSADLFEERLRLMRLAARIDDRIEPHPFTLEDFNDTDPLVSEIRRTGVRIA